MAGIALFGAVFVGQAFPFRHREVEELVGVVQRVAEKPVVGVGHEMADTRV